MGKAIDFNEALPESLRRNTSAARNAQTTIEALKEVRRRTDQFIDRLNRGSKISPTEIRALVSVASRALELCAVDFGRRTGDGG